MTAVTVSKRIGKPSLTLKVERRIKKLPKGQKEAIVAERPTGGFFDDDGTIGW